MMIGLLGCSDQTEKTEEVVNPDEVFIDEFSKAINNRWAEQDKIDETISEKEYAEINVEILEKELETIEKYLADVEDKELKELGTQYVEGAEFQIEMFKTNDLDLQYDYYEQSEKLRKPALIKLVDEYNVTIEEAFQQHYKDFKEIATVIDVENEANEFAEKLIQDIVFEKTTDEYGDLIYTAIVENTSEIEFDTISYDVQFLDDEGIVIENDFIYLENFMPGTKHKVELIFVPENTDSLKLTLDYFYLK